MHDTDLFLLLIISAPVLALIPAYIAGRKGRSFLGFFIYGLFFWVIALIHALIMEGGSKGSRTNQSEHSSPQTFQRPLKTAVVGDLSDDSYKLHLSEKYSIQKNEVFEKFVCAGNMFDTLEAALAYAHAAEVDRASKHDVLSAEAEITETSDFLSNQKTFIEALVFFLISGFAGLSIFVFLRVLQIYPFSDYLNLFSPWWCLPFALSFQILRAKNLLDDKPMIGLAALPVVLPIAYEFGAWQLMMAFRPLFWEPTLFWLLLCTGVTAFLTTLPPKQRK